MTFYTLTHAHIYTHIPIEHPATFHTQSSKEFTIFCVLRHLVCTKKIFPKKKHTQLYVFLEE